MQKLSAIHFLALIFLFGCGKQTENSSEDYTLGDIKYQFPVSTEASADFDKGLLLLYSFEYVDANEAFWRHRQLMQLR